MQEQESGNRRTRELELVENIVARVLAQIPAPAGPAVRQTVYGSTEAAA